MNNKVIQLCAQGMEAESKTHPEKAKVLFKEAWDLAVTDFEKFTAAHYVARHQETIQDKLKWDELALEFALNIKDQDMRESLPSLYLNIGKGHEDLNHLEKARECYELGFSYAEHLGDDGYGNHLKKGLEMALKRTASDKRAEK